MPGLALGWFDGGRHHLPDGFVGESSHVAEKLPNEKRL